MKELELVKVLPSIKIENELEVQNYVNELVSSYSGLVVDEENFKECKKTKQEINKLAKQLSDKRISIVKEIKAPIDEFETKVKEWTNSIKEVVNEIDEGVKYYEEQIKEEKKQELEEYSKVKTEELGIELRYDLDSKLYGLSATLKSSKETIDYDLQQLKTYQDTIITTLNNANRVNLLNTPLDKTKYIEMANMNDLATVINQINIDAEERKNVEQNITSDGLEENLDIEMKKVSKMILITGTETAVKKALLYIEKFVKVEEM